MTVIAWDGRTLAADKRATDAGYGVTTTKIFRVRDSLVGAAGPGDVCRALIEWARAGFEPSAFPDSARSDVAELVVVSQGGRIARFFRGPHPLVVEDRFTAAGCGRDYALAAMYVGCDAPRAVEVACALDIHCGNGIDVLRLE